MASQASFLVGQFLDWVAQRPRRYADLREAWSSTCPLNAAWEDAIGDGLVQYRRDGVLELTERGQARLAQTLAEADRPAP